MDGDYRPISLLFILLSLSTLLWQSINVGESNKRRLISPAFFALAFQNELHYRCLKARINRADDGATSYTNLVNICVITPKIAGLICVSMYLYWVKLDLHTFIRRSAIQKCHGILEN